MPRFLHFTKQTIKNLNSLVPSRTKHTDDYPTGLLSFKNSRKLARWRKSDEPKKRQATLEFIALADLDSISLEGTKIVDAKGDERGVDGRQTLETGAADLGHGKMGML